MEERLEQIFYQILYKNAHRAYENVLGDIGSLGKWKFKPQCNVSTASLEWLK